MTLVGVSFDGPRCPFDSQMRLSAEQSVIYMTGESGKHRFKKIFITRTPIKHKATFKRSKACRRHDPHRNK